MTVIWCKPQCLVNIFTCFINTPNRQQQGRPIGEEARIIDILRRFWKRRKGARQITLSVELDGSAHHSLPIRFRKIPTC